MGIVVYFEDGQVSKIEPEPGFSYYQIRDLINSSNSIVSDGIPYDLTQEDSIRSISIPKYKFFPPNNNAKDLGVTGYLEYVLRMHAGLLWREGQYHISMVCLEKACQLMEYSTILWPQSEYFRIVNWYIELGKFKKAAEWKKWIYNHTKSTYDYAKDDFEQTIQSCKYIGTDLVEVGDCAACCCVCAKYRKRVYSLSGKTWKFPKFPADFCFRCGLKVLPFIEGISEPSFKCSNLVLYSRRLFRDDRSKRELESYRDRLVREEKERSNLTKADLNHIIYYWFKPKFPNDFPKSVSGFSRMRNANSKNYQRLMQMVEAAGYKIPKSLEEVAEWEQQE